ncbi:MAG: hypothetical protein B5766_09180 [Candidatus Lumbricidophila eiseniae]|uniref:Uncharacterized protein n=1 Tax=Candidatus Lumbricidiphila eiseniae TaxID=1969409 RepID=A0A2A6FQM7_9MICO|nr:MAG: hypothetical protein B5766_09180 [Candidatus Lumbricidophila eiseniae]
MIRPPVTRTPASPNSSTPSRGSAARADVPGIQSVCFLGDNESVYWFHLGMNSLIHCFVPMMEFDSSVSERGAVIDVCGGAWVGTRNGIRSECTRKLRKFCGVVGTRGVGTATTDGGADPGW